MKKKKAKARKKKAAPRKRQVKARKARSKAKAKKPARGSRAKRAAAVVRAAAKGVKAKATALRADKAEQLIAKGRERGYITYSEILKEFPTVEEDINFLDQLYERFGTAGIDVLEGGILEDNADDYLASRNIKGRDAAANDSIQI
jgi:RNA polymerase primary sigma factor